MATKWTGTISELMNENKGYWFVPGLTDGEGKTCVKTSLEIIKLFGADTRICCSRDLTARPVADERHMTADSILFRFKGSRR